MPFIELTNDDATNPNNSCGQVAITNHLLNSGVECSLKNIEKEFPPDICYGLFGTSSDRICQGLEKYGSKTMIGSTISEFKKCVDVKLFPIIMLSWWEGWIPLGHWTVAAEYDENAVYLLNYGWTKWEDLEKLWDGPLNWLVGMRKTFIV